MLFIHRPLDAYSKVFLIELFSIYCLISFAFFNTILVKTWKNFETSCSGVDPF